MTTCEECSTVATVRYYWPGHGSRIACAEHAAKAVTAGRERGWRITLHPWPDLCDQEGGTVTPERGHVPGKCTYNRGHDGAHSWELEP